MYREIYYGVLNIPTLCFFARLALRRELLNVHFDDRITNYKYIRKILTSLMLLMTVLRSASAQMLGIYLRRRVECAELYIIMSVSKRAASNNIPDDTDEVHF